MSDTYDYWKSIALTRWIFVGKVTSLLFTMLSRLVIASVPRSKHLLISWIENPYSFIFGCSGSSLLLEQAFSSCRDQELLFTVVHRLLLMVASPVAVC